MRQQPANLRIENANELAPFGDFDAEQLFDRERERMFLIHRRDIIEPVEIGHRLKICLVLDQLFGAAVQQSDMRVDALHHFPVKLKHEAQHAMGGRVLRPEIDGEVASPGFSHGCLRRFRQCWLFHRQAVHIGRPPTGSWRRRSGIPAPVSPAHRSPVSDLRRSALRQSR